MRSLLLLVVAALVVGCSSVPDTRSTPPIAEIDSRRGAQEVAECIRDGWQGVTTLGASIGGIMQTHGDGFSVIAPSPEMPWHVADIRPAGSGSNVKYHFFRTWQSPRTDIVATVRNCSK